jgi:hypothetical protein
MMVISNSINFNNNEMSPTKNNGTTAKMKQSALDKSKLAVTLN